MTKDEAFEFLQANPSSQVTTSTLWEEDNRFIYINRSGYLVYNDGTDVYDEDELEEDGWYQCDDLESDTWVDDNFDMYGNDYD